MIDSHMQVGAYIHMINIREERACLTNSEILSFLKKRLYVTGHPYDIILQTLVLQPQNNLLK